MRTSLMIATAMTLLVTPALARDVATAEVFTDSNSHYLDYKTSISEAKRELRKDLAAAKDSSDRLEAMAEYEAEIADADKDFRKEMAERGVVLPKGTVIVEEDVALSPR
jgi:hypothetical protein